MDTKEKIIISPKYQWIVEDVNKALLGALYTAIGTGTVYSVDYINSSIQGHQTELGVWFPLASSMFSFVANMIKRYVTESKIVVR